MAYYLGIDVGTSKVAISIINDSKKIISVKRVPTNADLPARVSGSQEQDTRKIMLALKAAISSIGPDVLKKISAIGVTGQMHGVVCWNKDFVSPLITWQDTRCSECGMMSNLVSLGLRDGFGVSSMAYLIRHGLWNKYEHATTIQAYVVNLLCGSPDPVIIDPSSAASMGAFKIFDGCWNTLILECLNIPVRVMAEIRDSGTLAGKTRNNSFGLPNGIPVILTAGDNQSAVFASSHKSNEELYLTVGTGAQLSAIVDRQTATSFAEDTTGLDIRPYLDGKFLLVNAILSGGKTFVTIANIFEEWLKTFNLPIPERKELFRLLDAQGTEHLNRDKLSILPNFAGERTNSSLRGKICGITEDNFIPGNVFAALAYGMLENIMSGFPNSIIEQKMRVVANGNGIRNLKTVQSMVPTVFELPLIMPKLQEEAATGAAMLATK